MTSGARRTRGFRALKGRTLKALESGARHFRQAATTPRGPLNVLALFEALPDIDVRVAGTEFSCRAEVEPLPQGEEARTAFDRTTGSFVMRLAPDTYAAVEAGQGRARFTVMHEFGHLVLHPRELMKFAYVEGFGRDRRRGHEVWEDTEWQADGFSAAVLSPIRELLDMERRAQRSLTTAELVERFGISWQAAGYRLTNFNDRRHKLV